jgi:hypothetical protein
MPELELRTFSREGDGKELDVRSEPMADGYVIKLISRKMNILRHILIIIRGNLKKHNNHEYTLWILKII